MGRARYEEEDERRSQNHLRHATGRSPKPTSFPSPPLSPSRQNPAPLSSRPLSIFNTFLPFSPRFTPPFTPAAPSILHPGPSIPPFHKTRHPALQATPRFVSRIYRPQLS
eukprot:6209119-Pleurochrysis_carterae.AAC.2